MSSSIAKLPKPWCASAGAANETRHGQAEQAAGRRVTAIGSKSLTIHASPSFACGSGHYPLPGARCRWRRGKLTIGGRTLVALQGLPFRPGGAHEPSHSDSRSSRGAGRVDRAAARPSLAQSTGSAEPASWTTPRTADGHPDLKVIGRTTPIRRSSGPPSSATSRPSRPRKPPRSSNRRSTSCSPKRPTTSTTTMRSGRRRTTRRSRACARR